jgi:S1-C subfamily serine protease
MWKQWTIACACLCLLAGLVSAQTEEQATVAAARKALQTNEKAIISLNAVLKFEAKGLEIPGLDQERKTQCVAAVVTPAGLAVTSLTNLNPQKAIGKIPINRGGVRTTLELDCQIQEVKYRLPDGTEIPAQVVLKDDDLDLAFLSPQKPLDDATKAKLSAISLSDAAPTAEILDTTIHIGRTDESMNYIPTLNLGRVVAIVKKPRSCYMVNQGALGAPVFDRNGKVLGLVCRCVRPETEDGAKPIAIPFILPTADVAKLVPQAEKAAVKAAEKKAKKAEAKKTTEKKSAADKAADKAAKKPAEEKAGK